MSASAGTAFILASLVRLIIGDWLSSITDAKLSKQPPIMRLIHDTLRLVFPDDDLPVK